MNDTLEFLVRVEASCAPSGLQELPLVKGWLREKSTIDHEMQVRYATYTKILEQPVTAEGPDIDAIADATSELELQLETSVNDTISYEKKVFMITGPIAVWTK